MFLSEKDLGIEVCSFVHGNWCSISDIPLQFRLSMIIIFPLTDFCRSITFTEAPPHGGGVKDHTKEEMLPLSCCSQNRRSTTLVKAYSHERESCGSSPTNIKSLEAYVWLFQYVSFAYILPQQEYFLWIYVSGKVDNWLLLIKCKWICISCN